MRPFVALVVLACCLRADAAQAQEAYPAVLLEYLTGDADAAIVKLRLLDREETLAGVEAFNTTRARQVLPGAAALHTEAALRTRLDGTRHIFHLDIATAIVQFGERDTKLKSNSSLSLNPASAAPVSEDFRRLWYATVISVLEDAGRLDLVRGYVAHAVALYPDHGEIQLLAGIEQEMRGSPRTSGMNEGDRRDALKVAEKHYRAAVAAQPDRIEARLRLGRVLQQRKQFDAARAELAPLVDVPDNRIAYLAALFLGGLEDALGNTQAAAEFYDRATARAPTAQTARLASSELRYRSGDRQAAADAVRAGTGDNISADPWWTYGFGEYWRGNILLDALRKLRRA